MNDDDDDEDTEEEKWELEDAVCAAAAVAGIAAFVALVGGVADCAGIPLVVNNKESAVSDALGHSNLSATGDSYGPIRLSLHSCPVEFPMTSANS